MGNLSDHADELQNSNWQKDGESGKLPPRMALGVCGLTILLLGFAVISMYTHNRDLSKRLETVESLVSEMSDDWDAEPQSPLQTTDTDRQKTQAEMKALRQKQDVLKDRVSGSRKSDDRLATDIHLLKSQDISQARSLDRLENDLAFLKRNTTSLERDVETMDRNKGVQKGALDKLTRQVERLESIIRDR